MTLAPSIDPTASLAIQAAVRTYGEQFEVAFRASFCSERQAVTRAVAVARGNRQRVPWISSQFRAGDLSLHVHPSGCIEPSDADVELALLKAQHGVGSAITDARGERLYLITDPALLLAPPSDAARAAVDRWERRIRRWRLGRFSLEWSPPALPTR